MFRIGQKVVRIGGTTRYKRLTYPPIGEPCTVANVFKTDEGILHIELIEYPSPDTEEFYAGFNAVFFRPIVEKKTDISVFEEILRRETVDDRAPSRVAD